MTFPTFDFNGLEAVRLTAPDGATAIVTCLGAQVVSWIPAGGSEQLYLSPRARFESDTPIRGGVPLIFPQFADNGPLPRHGFARTSAWEVTDIRQFEDSVIAVFTLNSDEVTEDIWPHRFRAEFTVAVSGSRLDLELDVENTEEEGGPSFDFQAALHTYLKVKEVEQAPLTGLHGLRYRDRCDGQDKEDTGTELLVDDEVDRLYTNVRRPLMLQDGRRTVGLHHEGFSEMVVWNPWEYKCAELDDMPPNGFRHMLCIEPAAVMQPIELAPGQNWWGRQTLVCL